jgi:hypothetical protein
MMVGQDKVRKIYFYHKILILLNFVNFLNLLPDLVVDFI